MDEYIGIVKLFAGTFAPQNWAFCNGAILNISQYQALFSLLGTQYGGNGTTTFALPNLMGRVAVGAGNGAGLPSVVPGQMAGTASVTLNTTNLPAHTHGQQFVSGAATTPTPAAGLSLAQANGTVTDSGDGLTAKIYGSAGTAVAGGQTAAAGGGQPLNIMPPYLGMNYIICLNGVYPSRS